MGKFEKETDKSGYIRFVSVVYPFQDCGNGDWVGLWLGCSSFRDWKDAGFFPLQWQCGHDRREVEEVGDGLTED